MNRLASVKVSSLNSLRDLDIKNAEASNEKCEADNAIPEAYTDVDAINVYYYKKLIDAEPENGYHHFF